MIQTDCLSIVLRPCSQSISPPWVCIRSVMFVVYVLPCVGAKETKHKTNEWKQRKNNFLQHGGGAGVCSRDNRSNSQMEWAKHETALDRYYHQLQARCGSKNGTDSISCPKHSPTSTLAGRVTCTAALDPIVVLCVVVNAATCSPEGYFTRCSTDSCANIEEWRSRQWQLLLWKNRNKKNSRKSKRIEKQLPHRFAFVAHANYVPTRAIEHFDLARNGRCGCVVSASSNRYRLNVSVRSVSRNCDAM